MGTVLAVTPGYYATEALTAGDWTRLDPYTVNVRKEEGLAQLADHIGPGQLFSAATHA